ncbi:MAG: DUF134 domain-containing protein [Candidatus Margulisbacteria bacterium]|nr:DUF134 domain-containing protein [Candidatus Margulisiibacteriota bacterium]
MRPKKQRFICCSNEERKFRPVCKCSEALEQVQLTLDEFEAIRLCDHEGLLQDAVAGQMKVHRTTVSRILSSAHAKIADALIHLKEIRIAGGCCSPVVIIEKT